jgi:hypothetical protein
MSPLLPHLFIFVTILTSFLFFLSAFYINFSDSEFGAEIFTYTFKSIISLISFYLTKTE